MTFNKKISSKFQEQDVGIQVELGDDATYLVILKSTIYPSRCLQLMFLNCIVLSLCLVEWRISFLSHI
jgi:hypothetical protein